MTNANKITIAKYLALAITGCTFLICRYFLEKEKIAAIYKLASEEEAAGRDVNVKF